MSSILEMPELVMEKIIEFSDFKAVLTLRQVCCDFRNFVDDLKDSKLPDAKFQLITLQAGNKPGRPVNENKILLTCDDQNGSQKLSYCESYSSSRRENSNGKTTDLGNSNIVDVAIRDLELLLKFQKSDLDLLSFHFNNLEFGEYSSVRALPVELTTMFRKLNRKIKTRELSIRTDDNSHMIPILKFVDPETLMILRIFSLNIHFPKKVEADEIVKTEQWKNAEELVCRVNLLNLNVEDLFHFSWFHLTANSFEAEDFDKLKKAYTSSSKFRKWQLNMSRFAYEQLSDIWGPAFVLEQYKNWYFRMKNSEENVLHIRIRNPVFTDRGWHCYYCINFFLLETRCVPSGANTSVHLTLCFIPLALYLVASFYPIHNAYIAPLGILMIKDHGSVSTFTMIVTNKLLRKAIRKLFSLSEYSRKSEEKMFERKQKKISGVYVLN
ncbi:hypothetical protein B9Z55_021199 [Caenorhabditis nigoni]|uniref:F-box domain-containing protein n=1 Tax=Caenorhabditis nigoni TaxID=1611254 RepID=A0A2G5TQZ5_9PELO|nr:hypothetical protein B9Z55_021199 [Caenorhabditis nigoni]